MYNNATPLCSESKATHVYSIAGSLKVTVAEKNNPFGLPIASLFSMAARNNPKRSFLFVSKLLGKHIPIDPHASLLAGYALAALLCRHLEPQRAERLEPLLQLTMAGLADPSAASDAYRRLIMERLQPPARLKLLGFAETATALGHAMFDAFESKASYLHTTRELLPDRVSVLQFEEEHSHATAHRCYAEGPAFLADDETVVFVDDEMTTGKTTLNLIRDMHAKFPRKRYIAAALLDWRSEASEAAFAALEQEYGISIETICLYRGTIEVEGEAFPEGAPQQGLLRTGEDADGGRCPAIAHHRLESVFAPVYEASADTSGSRNDAPYMKETGRFGLRSEDREAVDRAIARAAEQLRPLRAGGGKTLVVGTGEFMYVPMRIAAELGERVYYQSTTRSPIHPLTGSGYAVRDGVTFTSPDDKEVRHYLYNLGAHAYDEVFIILERDTPQDRLAPMLKALSLIDCKAIHVVNCAGAGADADASAGAVADASASSVQESVNGRAAAEIANSFIYAKSIAPPAPLGSYSPEDVTFLLKDLRDAKLEMPTEDKEEAIQSGVHYSEMLPAEYEPSERYLQLYHETLDQSAELVAEGVAAVAELIVRKRGLPCVLVSLARAGTPIGVLIKRYIERRYGVSLPHYSISIIRGKGIDENALLYILQEHGVNVDIQFVDGWTGKGAIRRELIEACRRFEARYGIALNDDLAVLADPGRCAETYGTREDYLIPSACLNATVSGLMSRTVLKPGLIGPDDFHGSKFYEHWRGIDQSNRFVNRIASHFGAVSAKAAAYAEDMLRSPRPATWQGLADIKSVQAAYGIDDINLVKPGVGETSRVLLRRVPWKILVDRPDNPHLRPILMLAEERGVPVETFPGLAYSCCGIIKPLKGGAAE